VRRPELRPVSAATLRPACARGDGFRDALIGMSDAVMKGWRLSVLFSGGVDHAAATAVGRPVRRSLRSIVGWRRSAREVIKQRGRALPNARQLMVQGLSIKQCVGLSLHRPGHSSDLFGKRDESTPERLRRVRRVIRIRIGTFLDRSRGRRPWRPLLGNLHSSSLPLWTPEPGDARVMSNGPEVPRPLCTPNVAPPCVLPREP
jgi:hypothetical protein